MLNSILWSRLIMLSAFRLTSPKMCLTSQFHYTGSNNNNFFLIGRVETFFFFCLRFLYFIRDERFGIIFFFWLKITDLFHFSISFDLNNGFHLDPIYFIFCVFLFVCDFFILARCFCVYLIVVFFLFRLTYHFFF